MIAELSLTKRMKSNERWVFGGRWKGMILNRRKNVTGAHYDIAYYYESS
jgi:inosine/xanthosine triphosphate pyrophosphatase family protein